jgi:dihydroorotase
VTAEVTPHHLTLTEKAALGFNTSAKVNPPLRTEKDVKALIQGLKEGVIDIIATDHAPHTDADKNCEFTRAASGISGLETALGSLMGLVHTGELSLHTLIAKLTTGPARILKDQKLGTLEVGAPADITIFDPDQEWLVDTSKFASKGRNTPLAGKTLKGKVMATIFNGKLVYKDDSVKIEARETYG